MIPRVIYYCWFGNNPLPKLAFDCIDSWKRNCPGFEIRRIDETNFDIDTCKYVKEAYECRKWAFVSDYARLWILEQNGGLYFDTDVELLSSIDDLLQKDGEFLACEYCYSVREDSLLPFSKKGNHGVSMRVNPGLGMGFEAHNQILNQALRQYESECFLLPNGKENLTTIVARVTAILREYGFDASRYAIQDVNGVSIYPPDYFAGYNLLAGSDERTSNTRAIHHYAGSWTSAMTYKKNVFLNKFSGKGKVVFGLGYAITAPLAIAGRLQGKSRIMQ